jgi:hypothetical protein
MSEIPSVRAFWPQRLLVQLERHDARASRLARARLDAGVLNGILEASRTSWVPIDQHLALLRAIHGELGDMSFEAFIRGQFSGAIRESFLKSMFLSGLRLFGRSRLALTRLFPRGFDAVYRNVGSMESRIAEDGRGSFIELSSAPPALTTDPMFGLALRAALLGLLDVAKVAGRVELDLVDVRTRTVRLRVVAHDPKVTEGPIVPVELDEL